MAGEVGEKRPSILIVDDEFGLAEVLRDILLELGHDVRLAINGRLALAALRDYPADIVLTDVMMPVMGGAELARALRADAAFDHVRIIFMTSLASAVPREAREYGPVLEKPFTPDSLLAAMRAAG
jgi:CheY-like chemotaxis protein